MEIADLGVEPGDLEVLAADQTSEADAIASDECVILLREFPVRGLQIGNLSILVLNFAEMLLHVDVDFELQSSDLGVLFSKLVFEFAIDLSVRQSLLFQILFLRVQQLSSVVLAGYLEDLLLDL